MLHVALADGLLRASYAFKNFYRRDKKENIMALIWTILIGFVAGLVARAVTPGNQNMGFFLTAVLGIAGSLAATYLGQALGWYAAGAGAGFIASVIGAVVVLFVFGLVTRKRV